MRAALFVLIFPVAAWARPTAPALFCARYPTAPQCAGKMADCTVCHIAPPDRNVYGKDLEAHGVDPNNFDATLPPALAAVESLDSDGDGTPNLAEILDGTGPGDPNSHPTGAASVAGTNPDYNVGAYDIAYAYRRMSSAFCGKSPGYSELKAVTTSSDPKAALHTQLDTCLKGTFWREEQLPRFADPRVRPLGSAGTCLAMYGNFEPDYYLFVWALTDDHDARDLVTAQYHVQRNADGSLSQVDESAQLMQPPQSRAGLVCKDRYGHVPSQIGGEPLAIAQRAGLLTTQWYLWTNTMGSLMPRGTAALAYKSWLGYDISLSQGLSPAPNEPRDIDNRGVGAMPCSNCHSTLDPLAYAFAYYWGGTSATTATLQGTYLKTRYEYVYGTPDSVKASWAANPPRPYLLGQSLPLESETTSSALVVMGQRMAATDEFARNLALIFFTHAVGHAPLTDEQADFEALWRGLEANQYSANKMLHALVDTQSFGAP